MDEVQQGTDWVLSFFEKNESCGHLRARKRGKLITVFSEDEAGEIPHARFRLLQRNTWAAEFPKHTGRWEKTPFTGELETLVEMALTRFPWLFAPVS